MKSSLFISYSRVDSEFAIRLVRDLKEHGISVWLDQVDIPAGVNWDEEIESALAEAETVLLLLSAHSVQSANVKNEISHSLELKKHVVPILLEEVPVPLMITRLQREDFTGDYGVALARLVHRLGRGTRTGSLQAITADDVQRISEASAARLGGERPSGTGARRAMSGGGRTGSRESDAKDASANGVGSLSPAVTPGAVRQVAGEVAARPKGKRRLYGVLAAAGLGVLALGLAVSTEDAPHADEAAALDEPGAEGDLGQDPADAPEELGDTTAAAGDPKIDEAPEVAPRPEAAAPRAAAAAPASAGKVSQRASAPPPEDSDPPWEEEAPAPEAAAPGDVQETIYVEAAIESDAQAATLCPQLCANHRLRWLGSWNRADGACMCKEQ